MLFSSTSRNKDYMVGGTRQTRLSAVKSRKRNCEQLLPYERGHHKIKSDCWHPHGTERSFMLMDKFSKLNFNQDK